MKRLGILLDEKDLTKVIRKKRAGEDVKQYNKACQENKLVPVYMCLQQINLSAKRITGYEYRNGTYRKVTIALPKVIYNRAMPPENKLRLRLKQLNKQTHVFNAKTRYSKYYIHRLLHKHMAANLPDTKKYTKANLEHMMKRYNSLYIKPQSGSVGEGIIKITKISSKKWRIHKTKGKLTASPNHTVQFVQRHTASKPFLIQQSIPLGKINGKPFDLRINVQRDRSQHWRVTAMIAKVAPKGSHVTNVFQGGTIKKVPPLFRDVFSDPDGARHTVEQFSLRVVRHLGGQIRHFSDVGLDIAITNKGKPYFIEVNGRDQRYGLKVVKLHQAYYRVHKTPIDYASTLLNNRS